MNFLTSTKDPEDYAKNVGMFHHNSHTDENLSTGYVRYRDMYENIMAGRLHASQIVMLRKINRTYICSIFNRWILPT
ncbi:unnamed protein product [Hymenolepis diminuta]|uniref:Uncharacterized protein n=1 Tax=Hymenolepis diminuta TaxID=6216 RepID=A0A564Z8T2_HYMDI|nr:unnamed protein product [Hymenolepis diminuta]